MSGRPILVMAGGTGGHVFPGLAVAEHLRGGGEEVQWLGTARGLEARVVPAAGMVLHTLPMVGLRGKGLVNWLLAPWRLGIALWAALLLMMRVKPRLVLGMGGFASGPGGLVASALNIPLVIHEQNAVAGLTNRWLARVADRVLEAFPGTFPEKVGALHTGNPVRGEIAGLPLPDQRFQGRRGPLRLLVLGGSLGALALNETVPAALARLPVEARPLVRHQTGERTLEQATQAYGNAGVRAEITAFIEDMGAAYAWADLVVCRAGALTVAELAAAGVGAILVPYPHAVDDHQTVNARFLTRADAAVLIPPAELDAQRLAAELSRMDRTRALAMAQAARSLATPDATRVVAGHCLDLIPGGRP
ncbi:undecaprenyldiphospho-muramoylpentapeptide beta-N-acetylglucosaminyltransferase [Thioalkalivibrio thiocyanodenitrificans]|uniref:undecaprenyldiphospho-muramoylpentapeptide beta-N-acetylglucosaminyltransferase n=1 Tax=Thioalkalivibrio thiocyanodenitrificans TaxID=243063 RepID=UPI0003785EAD|nr:undecaprenyldiphospho-muramoylpentapeptide beta-N-acetylglucosaminyltransferase [Thioalkalivibrio thiocyanodenitrificans]